MSDIKIIGEPGASFTLWDLPSWNKTMNLHPLSRSSHTKKMREQGYLLAREFLSLERMFSGPVNKPFFDRGLVVVKVYTPHDKLRDIYNVNIKHVFDGFVDAGLLHDDEWVFLPVTVLMWAGYDENPKRVKKRGRTRSYAVTKTIIEIHELDQLIINDTICELPLGRFEVQ